jgi:hypothetical protein
MKPELGTVVRGVEVRRLRAILYGAEVKNQ